MSDRPVKSPEMNWVNPYLMVSDPQSALKFYEDAFGFKTNMTVPDKDGGVMHAEMQYHDCIIMLGAEQSHWPSAKTLAGSPVSLYVYVDGVDDFFQRAKKAGAEIKSEPTTQFYGDRTFTALCPEGHVWTFAQKVADWDPSKMPK